MTELIISGMVSCLVAFFAVYLGTPPLIRLLERHSVVVRDVHKKGIVMVPRPGGPSIILGIVSSQAVLYAFLQLNEILAVILVTVLAFLIGYVDDRRVMGGWFKPVALAAAAAPILLLGAYDPVLEFPVFGVLHIPVLYVGVVFFMILVTGNTVNSIDVLNGAASGFMTIAGLSLSASLFILQNYEMSLASLSLALVSLAFYKYHKIPSRIFPGDSGALSLGVMYGTIALVGQVEVIAAVALLPAILNSFLFLSSIRRIVEHREIKAQPVEHTKDMMLKSTSDADAPVTLVRLILARGPLSEAQVSRVIFKLAAFSGSLAVMTAVLTVLF